MSAEWVVVGRVLEERGKEIWVNLDKLQIRTESHALVLGVIR